MKITRNLTHPVVYRARSEVTIRKRYELMLSSRSKISRRQNRGFEKKFLAPSCKPMSFKLSLSPSVYDCVSTQLLCISNSSRNSASASSKLDYQEVRLDEISGSESY